MSGYVQGESTPFKLRAEVDRLRRENQQLVVKLRNDDESAVQRLTPLITAQFNELHQIRGKNLKSARRRKQIAMAHAAAIREEDARKGAHRMRIILEEIDAHNREKKAS